MTSSGKKRWAAVAATSALALSGLAMSSASARTIDDQIDPTDVTVLYSPTFGGNTQVDGNGETTVRLLAGASKAFGAVTTNAIRFYDLNTGGTLLDVTVPVVGGVALYEWNPPAGNGVVNVVAQALGSGGIPLGAPSGAGSVDTDNLNLFIGAVSIDGSFRARKGYFINSVDNAYYAAFTGDFELFPPALSAVDPATNANVNTVGVTPTSTPDVNGNQNWQAVLDVDVPLITPLVDGDDDLVIRAENFFNDSTAQVFTSYQQFVAVNTPTLTTAPGSTTNVFGDSDGVGGQPAANNYSLYDVKVLDQEGQPVAGANIWEAQPNGTPTNCPSADFVSPTDPNVVIDPDNQQTTGNGTVRIRKQESQMDVGGPLCDDNPAGGIDVSTFVVDANGDGDYDAGTDTILKASQTNIAAAPATVTITGSKGENLDDDETHDVTIKVTDASGNPVVNTNVAVKIGQDNRTAPGESVALTNPGIILPPTNAQGEIVISGADANMINGTSYDNDWVFQTWQVTAGTVSATTTFEFDMAELHWTGSQVVHDVTTVQALNGTTVDASGELRLRNGGGGLSNRLVGHRYFPSVDANGGAPGILAGNSGYSPVQPAGTVSGTPVTATSTTSAAGGFTVRISDPAAPNGEELNSKSLVEAVGLSLGEAPFNYGAPDGNNVGVQVNVSDLLDVDFLRSLDVADLRIINGFTGTQADGLESGVDGDDDLTPGATGLGWVEARNADGVLLVNKDVNLTIEEGHFVTDFEATPVPGQPLDFNDAGKAATVSTGSFGIGNFVVNIERHEGFDDNGVVDDNMTATSGASTDRHDLVWTTEEGNPLNQDPSDINVEFSDDNESSILPEARSGNVSDNIDGDGDGDGLGQVVDFDVETVDQFGNRTSQAINVTDKTNSPADDDDTGESEYDQTQPAAWAWLKPPADVDQTLEVELNGARKTVYVDNAATSAFDPTNPAFPVVQQPQDIEEDSPTINWYEVNFDSSTYTLEQQGANTVQVGTLVTEILKAVDQKGQPLENLGVDFLRGGPSNEDDDGCFDDNNEPCIYTNQQGEAFYDFVGGTIGTATVTAVLYDDNFDRVRTIGPDTVRFVGEQIQVHINALLQGRSSQGKDILTVNAPNIAKGAAVKIQKKINGKWTTIGKTKTLDGSGNRQFGFVDRNGKRVTKYRAKVSATDFIFGDNTPVKRLK